MKKWIQILGVALLLITLAALGDILLGSKFKAGNCVQALDGYVWHINRYGFGNYSLMGWQNPWWGNEVTLEKRILERKNASDISEYHQIECPDPSTSNNS